MALTSLHATSVHLDLTSICGIMLGIITAKASNTFEVTVSWRVQGNYIWDHFQCWDSFVKKFLKEEMRWSLHRATCPGKRTPENIEQVLPDAALRLTSTISESDIPSCLIVNSDQTGAQYSAGGEETYDKIGSKQVEVIGMDEK